MLNKCSRQSYLRVSRCHDYDVSNSQKSHIAPFPIISPTMNLNGKYLFLLIYLPGQWNFCYHLSVNYVDLSDLYIDLSDIVVDLSDNFVVICMALTGQETHFKELLSNK